MNQEIDKNNIPKHVAIIMDGNRRWAAERDLGFTDGHEEALKRIEELIEHAAQMGVQYMTLWAWSPKNWKRSKDFIEGIFKVFRGHFADEDSFKRAIDKGVKFKHIGEWDGFPKDIIKKSEEHLSIDPNEKTIEVNMAVGYEGRKELVRAVKNIVQEGIDPEDIDDQTISDHLYTAGQPDVDLMIRTGGDMRTSGYMIWQLADAEYYFTDTYFPDFTIEKFDEAILSYQARERRMGGDSKKY